MMHLSAHCTHIGAYIEISLIHQLITPTQDGWLDISIAWLTNEHYSKLRQTTWTSVKKRKKRKKNRSAHLNVARVVVLKDFIWLSFFVRCRLFFSFILLLSLSFGSQMNRLACFETFTPYETGTENQRMVVICGPRCYTYKCVAVF